MTFLKVFFDVPSHTDTLETRFVKFIVARPGPTCFCRRGASHLLASVLQ